MAGVVTARIELYSDRSVDVLPDTCPVEQRHPGEGDRCYQVTRNGERRSCIYWIACLNPSQRAERQDVTMIVTEATARSARTVHCQVLCQRQKANRPPGC